APVSGTRQCRGMSSPEPAAKQACPRLYGSPEWHRRGPGLMEDGAPRFAIFQFCASDRCLLSFGSALGGLGSDEWTSRRNGLTRYFRAWALQNRVIGALLMREIQLRWGRRNLGFAW